MELLPLPNFHWEIYIFTFLLLFLVIVLLFKKRKRKKVVYKDIYEASLYLQKVAPNDPKVQELLKKLEPYKYAKKSPPLPKELKKELTRLQKKLRK